MVKKAYHGLVLLTTSCLPRLFLIKYIQNMRFSLLKLIDVAILPVILAIVFKLFGLIISPLVYDLNLTISFENILPVFSLSYPNTNVELAVRSFSHVLMSGILAIGLCWLLIQAHYFHSTHISPL